MRAGNAKRADGVDVIMNFEQATGGQAACCGKASTYRFSSTIIRTFSFRNAERTNGSASFIRPGILIERSRADDSGRAVFGLEGVANVDVDVCGERALLQNHGVVKRDASWRVEFCNGAWSLACRACVKVGGAERHWIWRDLRRAAECF